MFLKTFLGPHSMGHGECLHCRHRGAPVAAVACVGGPWWASGTAQMLPALSRLKLSYLGMLRFLRHISRSAGEGANDTNPPSCDSHTGEGLPEFSAGLLAQSASVVAVPFVPPPPASSPLHFGARLLCACLSRVSSLVPQSSAILNAVRFLGPGAMRSQLSQELDSQVNLRIRRVGSRNIIGGPRAEGGEAASWPSRWCFSRPQVMDKYGDFYGRDRISELLGMDKAALDFSDAREKKKPKKDSSLSAV